MPEFTNESMDIEIANNKLDEYKELCFAAIISGEESKINDAYTSLNNYLIANSQLFGYGINAYGMLACLAMKNGNVDFAFRCLIDADAYSELANELGHLDWIACLSAIRMIGGMSARTQNELLFEKTVEVMSFWCQKQSQSSPTKIAEAIEAFLFMAADHRYLTALHKLLNLTLILTVYPNEVLLPFLRQWACICSQSARRGWVDVSNILLTGLFRFMLKKGDNDSAKNILFYVNVHLQMYCAWDGLSKALIAYAPLIKYSVLTLELAAKHSEAKEYQESVKVVLRFWRDFVAGYSRQQMQDEIQVYQALQDWFMRNENTEQQNIRLKRLLQLTLGYWVACQPKTALPQLSLIRDAFVPNYVEGPYLDLFNGIK